MAHTHSRDSSNAKKEVTDAMCSSTTSSLLAAFLQKISRPKESSSVQIEVTSYDEKRPSVDATKSTTKKTVVVLQKRKDEEESPGSGVVPGPSSSVLKNLHLDHQYLSKPEQDVAALVREKTTECPFLPKAMATKVYSIKLPSASIQNTEKIPPSTGKSTTTSPRELTGTEEFLKRRMQRAMDLLRKTAEEKSKKIYCTEGLTCIPNAAAIQSNFQSALNMTSFRPISDESGKTQTLDGNLFEILQNEKKSQKSDKSAEHSDKISDSKTINILSVDITKREETDTETDEQFYEAKLEYVLRLLIQRWSEYLRLSQEDLYQIDLENAKFFNSTPDVIEMLEDKGRFVWQLIEEL